MTLLKRITENGVDVLDLYASRMAYAAGQSPINAPFEPTVPSGHPVTVYTADESVTATLQVPTDVRLSHCLSNMDMPLAGTVFTGGQTREARFNRTFIEAIVDEIPARRDRSMIVKRTRMLVKVVFGSKLTVCGTLHVVDKENWSGTVNFDDVSFRAITEATISCDGQPLRENVDALVNLRLATRVELTPEK